MSDYNKLFLKDPLLFMRTYSVHPMDEVGGYQGDVLRELNSAPVTKFSRVKSAKKVAYVDLLKKPKGSIQVTGNEGSETIHFTYSFDERPRAMPIYFLPWDKAGAVVQMTIPSRGSSQPDPDYFFTAAINGCSVFFQGTADNPTVYHCGGDTARKDHAEAAKFWRDLVAATADSSKGKVMAEVNKMDYIKERGQQTTQRAVEFESWLKNQHKYRLVISSVNPWGCVMGIRRDGNWTFYLQENAAIVYTTMVKKHLFSKGQMETRVLSRPMTVREVYPNNTASGVSMKSSLPKYVS